MDAKLRGEGAKLRGEGAKLRDDKTAKLPRDAANIYLTKCEHAKRGGRSAPTNEPLLGGIC